MPAVTVYGGPEGLTFFQFTDDHWDRLISIKDFDIYKFQCPENSDLDTFMINMSHPLISKEYFDNYEEILCSDKSMSELADEMEDKMKRIFENLKQS